MLSDITAVIVNYKTLDLLETALEGLLGCYPTLQILLVDNASEDASTTYIETMARDRSNVSAILNRRNPSPPQPRQDQFPGSYPGDKAVTKIWAGGNVGHGPALHQAIHLCKTPYVFALDTDCIVLKCGFLEKMLREFDDPLVYAVGYLYAGPTGQPVKARIYQVHLSVALLDVGKYKSLHPFEHFGGVSTANYADAQKKGFKCVDFPVGGWSRRHADEHGDYIDHLFRGSRKRFKKIPHLRSKPLRPELMLHGIEIEYIGDYFGEEIQQREGAMSVSGVAILVTNCYRPAWTLRALESIRKFYPGNRVLVVDDCCTECPEELREMKEKFGVELLSMPERRGAGRAIDAGMTYLSGEWVLTYDHGIVLKQPILDLYLPKIADDVIGVGKRGGGNYCAANLGVWISCSLALWNREFIVGHGLTFKLTGLFLPPGHTSRRGTNVVSNCTTGQYLCYRAVQLGQRLVFANPRHWHSHEHARDHLGKRFPSPHEAHNLVEGEIDLSRLEGNVRRGR